MSMEIDPPGRMETGVPSPTLASVPLPMQPPHPPLSSSTLHINPSGPHPHLDLEGGFEPQQRARSNTWPLPRPENADGKDVEHLEGAVGGPLADAKPPGMGLQTKKNSSRRNAWGNMSYADLITQAISSAPDKKLTLSQIYDWMVQNITYFKDKGDSNSSAGWKNSIRHNLSLHNRFMRVQNEGTGKSSWWMLNPEAKPGKSARRRATSMETSKYEKKRGRARKRVDAIRRLEKLQEFSCVSHKGGSFCSNQRWSPSESPPRNGLDAPSAGSEGLEVFPESPGQHFSQLSPDFRHRTSSSASSCGRNSPSQMERWGMYPSGVHQQLYQEPLVDNMDTSGMKPEIGGNFYEGAMKTAQLSPNSHVPGSNGYSVAPGFVQSGYGQEYYPIKHENRSPHLSTEMNNQSTTFSMKEPSSPLMTDMPQPPYSITSLQNMPPVHHSMDNHPPPGLVRVGPSYHQELYHQRRGYTDQMLRAVLTHKEDQYSDPSYNGAVVDNQWPSEIEPTLNMEHIGNPASFDFTGEEDLKHLLSMESNVDFTPLPGSVQNYNSVVIKQEPSEDAPSTAKSWVH